jgi:CRP-like cAMP-binding protein
MISLESSLKSTFGIVRDDELKLITSFFKIEKLARDDFFLQAEKPCDKLSFLKDGFIRIFVQTDKKEVTQWISTPGYFITELSSFIANTPCRWNFQALTDIELYTISKKDYEQLHQLVPTWTQLEKLFIIHCFINLENRIFSHLSMTAEERYAYFFEHNRALFNQVPLHYIASMLGMTPETFSRVRKKYTP